MIPHTFIFIGRSGCGKGTQSHLLQDYIKQQDSQTPIYYLETGDGFRKFIAEDGYTNTLSRAVMSEGKRQPDFLAVWMWAHHFIKEITGIEHLFIDGTPRSMSEALILENALMFYQRTHIHVFHLNVSRDWSERHLLARGRADDVGKDIKERLDWYETDVVPAIEYFRNNDHIIFTEVNGEQSIEKVSQDVVAALAETDTQE